MSGRQPGRATDRADEPDCYCREEDWRRHLSSAGAEDLVTRNKQLRLSGELAEGFHERVREQERERHEHLQRVAAGNLRQKDRERVLIKGADLRQKRNINDVANVRQIKRKNNDVA